jgi:catechol 2,3-dioxygenase
MSGSAARLDHIQLLSEAPERLAAFYQSAMGMKADRVDRDLWLCAAPGRRLLIARGRSGTLGFGAYRLESADDVAAMRARLERSGVTVGPSRSPLFTHDAFSLADPDANTMVFGLGTSAPGGTQTGPALRGRLQHLVVASDDIEGMVQFYADVVGLPVSDKALQNGAVTACWLRTNHEHHTLAVFRAAGRRLDHYSYEVDDWSLIRDWADHFAAQGITLIWGPGRHGPGNNLFIMIHDPDANRVELSAELEIVDGARPVGIWPHEERTFNKWGQASLRT